MSLVFANEEYMQALLNFLFHTDVGRVSRVIEEVDSDYKELSDGGTGRTFTIPDADYQGLILIKSILIP